MEYTIDTIREFLVESNRIEEENSQDAHDDAFSAWGYLITQNKLDTGNILEAHRLLMWRLRNDIAGHLRKVPVRVGDWIAPNPGSVRRLLIQWLSELKKDEEIKQAHVAFEKIHPFEDGNGRIGRMIMNWQKVKADLPILVIHTGIEQQDYYKWFE